MGGKARGCSNPRPTGVTIKTSGVLPNISANAAAPGKLTRMLGALRRTLQAFVGIAFFVAGLLLGGFDQQVLWFMAAATVLGAMA